jgi:hypothetical protein
MYQSLLDSSLSEKYRLIAPDYPGFGHSSWPNPKEFAYTFDSLAKVMQDFAEQLHLDRYTLFMQDYWACRFPHGFGSPRKDPSNDHSERRFPRIRTAPYVGTYSVKQHP